MLDISVSGTPRSFDLDDPKLPDWVADGAMASGGYLYDKRLKKSQYEEELNALQLEMVKLQAHRRAAGTRILILFEGRDAAGKGGTIARFRTYQKARHARIVALAAPTETERGQWYFQRHIAHFPTAGDMVLFDRSWYNRGGVEPVMGFCTADQHQHFLTQAPLFERSLADDGIHLFKIWLNIGQEMQIKRFHERRHNPLKSWKLSPIDLKALTLWDAYTKARNEMLAATHTTHAPWTVVRSNDKRRARLNALRAVLSKLDYEGKDTGNIGPMDPKIIGEGIGFLKSEAE
ncbi:MAG: polyphosphate kinase 2 [Pseudomonadota bacterium]